MANGLWTPVYCDLWTHPKFLDFVDSLDSSGQKKYEIFAKLILFWNWCQLYADDGDVSRFSSAAIARGSHYDGDPDQWKNALLEFGFLDQNGDNFFVHDWTDYGGKKNFKNRTEADRKREERRRTSSDKSRTSSDKSRTSSDKGRTSSDKSRTSSDVTLHTTQHNTTQHNNIKQNKEHPPNPPGGTCVLDEKTAMIEKIYSAYPLKVAKAKALQAIEKAITGKKISGMSKREQISAVDLLACVQAFSNSESVRILIEENKKDKIPHCSTWMNGNRWEDQIERPATVEAEAEVEAEAFKPWWDVAYEAEIKDKIKKEVTPERFEDWFEEAIFHEYEPNKIVVMVIEGFHRDHLEKEYLDLIKKAVGESKEVVIQLGHPESFPPKTKE